MTPEELFEQGISRYQNGEAASELIPLFEEICERSAKNSAALTSLSWLYLLEGKAEAAQKKATKALKLQPGDPQTCVNLSLAMLETGKSGVRKYIERAQQVLGISEELRKEIDQNFEEGLKRRPEWPELHRVRSWLS